MDVILWSFQIALKLVGIAVAFLIFNAVLRNGTGVFKQIVETLGLTIQAICLKVRTALLKSIKKERENLSNDGKEEDQQVEAHVA